MENPYRTQSKVNPQPDKNYIQVSHQFLEALIEYPTSGAEDKVLCLILRKTWGFKKKSDQISLTQFTKKVPFSRPTIVKALKSLEGDQVIIVDRTKRINEYMANKFHDTWKKRQIVKQSDHQLRRVTRRVKESDQDRLTPLNTQKKKETLTKEKNNTAKRVVEKSNMYQKEISKLTNQVFKDMPAGVDQNTDQAQANKLWRYLQQGHPDIEFSLCMAIIQGKYSPEKTAQTAQRIIKVLASVSADVWSERKSLKSFKAQVLDCVRDPNKYLIG